MPDKCCVPFCSSNYDNTTDYVTVFRFPKSEALKNVWLKKIPRENLQLGKRTVVCSKHFKEEEIIRFDELPKDGKIIQIPRKIPKLKESAYLSIFPGCPSYLTEKKVPERKNRDSKLKEVDEGNFQKFQSYDLISSFQHLSNAIHCKIKDFHFENIVVHAESTAIFILFIDFTDVPAVKGSVKIDSEMCVRVFVEGMEINPSTFFYLLDSKNRLVLWSQLENILSRIPCIFSDKKEDKIFYEESIKYWNKYISSNNGDKNVYDCKHFIREQILLSSKTTLGKRYSTDLVTFSYFLYIKSPSAYNFLYRSNLLSLPSVDTLKRLNPFKINECSLSADSEAYMKMKCSKLETKDKLVNLLLDEIHVKPNVSYKGKTVVGFAENVPLEEAKSIQSFMISSVYSNFKEIAALVPVTKLTGDDLFNFTCTVLKMLENAGYNVLCIISDNNRINRNMFEKIAGGKIFDRDVKNPINNTKSLYLLFDTVHLIKSVRNNWINQCDIEKTLQYPDFDGTNIVRKAHFALFRKLYKIESQNLIKYAPKLNYKTLYPKNIERQNVNLALNIFHESNNLALEIFSKENSSFFNWKDTACFLNLIKCWWDIVNVSHLNKGRNTHNENSNAFKYVTDSRLSFLEKFAKWLNEWKDMNQKPRSGCLSNETFFALQHTSSTLVLVIKYLLQSGAKFVLTSKFQTDNLEAWFGQYRQMSGANYHISVQQILESERKLRVQGILQLHSNKHGKIPLKEFLTSVSNSDKSDIDISPFIFLADDIDLNTITKHELNILIYIAGYCVFKLNLSCAQCITLFLQSDNFFVEYKDIPIATADVKNYLSLVNRGGLKFPSSFVIDIVSYSYVIFQKILSEEYETLFLKYSIKQHTLFVSIVEMYLTETNLATHEICTECGYDTYLKVRNIIQIIGNICLNNYTKVMSDKLKSKTDERKLKKFKTS